jgi:UrcA family protein
MKIIRAVACAAVSIGVLAGSTAFADDYGSETRSVRVLFPDLNLATEHGTKTLFMRLQNAAQDVCGDTFDTPYIDVRVQVERCQQTAIESAVEQINQPLLISLYDRHYPHEAIADTRVSVKTDGAQALQIARRG